MACFKHFIGFHPMTSEERESLPIVLMRWGLSNIQTVNKIVLLNHTFITSGTTITFLCTPAHSNIPDSETADQLASGLPISTALEIHQKQSTLSLNLPDMYAWIKKSCVSGMINTQPVQKQLTTNRFFNTSRTITVDIVHETHPYSSAYQQDTAV